ncbi:AEC family transporter [Alkalihalobacillus pseudalcaliphilus]|uniref:AEC family transporter n=1 Tax=Alkalihalobacillus pseudalcaliphilus TaxID=79884 RepID=UPI00064D9F0C|nr:hypothetical protein [Alkalihalobacillus pseudalcaliphilus]KMK76130.1 hypothetical protein AB990_12965 [Alkalihalobacillus pseudalcaliphilus]
MLKFILAIAIIIGGLLVGRLLRLFIQKNGQSSRIPFDKMIQKMIPFVLLGINPIILLAAFWIVEIEEMKFLLLPVLGIFALIIGGALAILSSRLLRHQPVQTGAMFVSGSFSNWGAFGMLFCFLLLGEMGLAFAAMVRLFEELFYYTVCFPVAKGYGPNAKQDQAPSRFKKIVTDPFILVTFSAISIGAILNFSGIVRPELVGNLNEFLVPLASFLLVVPLGFTMKVNSVRKYYKEGLIISSIKFISVPIITVSAAWLLGLGAYQDGLLIYVLLILSAMPPAVMSLVPAQLYKLDIELANANWIVSTSMLLVVLPILYLLIP